MSKNTQIICASALLLLCGQTGAQYDGGIEIPENVLEAIREFNERPPGAPNEVIVVLDPPGQVVQDGEENEDAEKPASVDNGEIDDVVAAILEDADSLDADVRVVDPESGDDTASHGPEVRVQRLRDPGYGTILPADVKISTPFAAKPLGNPSPGWRLVSSPDAPAYTRSVEVAPGTLLTLSIRPHVLIPDADGRDAFQIQEPGFDPTMGYNQRNTLSASIASSIRQLEEDAVVLGQVMDQLEQILISLPKSDN